MTPYFIYYIFKFGAFIAAKDLIFIKSDDRPKKAESEHRIKKSCIIVTYIFIFFHLMMTSLYNHDSHCLLNKILLLCIIGSYLHTKFFVCIIS